MKHYIIVKFNEGVAYKEFISDIKKLFSKAKEIDGVDNIEIFVDNSNLSNRYDLMIKMTLTKEGLINFDLSNIHKEWKETYSKYILNKVIFDHD